MIGKHSFIENDSECKKGELPFSLVMIHDDAYYVVVTVNTFWDLCVQIGSATRWPSLLGRRFKGNRLQ